MTGMIEIRFLDVIIPRNASFFDSIRTWFFWHDALPLWLADTQFLAALTWTTWTLEHQRSHVQVAKIYALFRSVEDYALFRLWYPDFEVNWLQQRRINAI